MSRISPGDLVVYRRRDSSFYELGRVVRRNNSNDGWFVCYSSGDTAANTPDDCLFSLSNAYFIDSTSLGGSRFNR